MYAETLSDALIAIMKRHVHEDIHNKLMQAYDTVPNSWYIGTLVINICAGSGYDSRLKAFY
jgi:hypothetical protein